MQITCQLGLIYCNTEGAHYLSLSLYLLFCLALQTKKDDKL